jgi:single-strand DNA-binding protein|tara:strand:+ start:423 stop:866 length:444 start_codon:yes stop_codon:yes gene_type:complete
MFAKLVRLGRDAEVKYTQNGDPVASLAMVYDIGFGDKKRSQWIDGTLWGKRAESLGPYLTKGSQVVLYADDVELEQFMKKDGTPGAKLKCRVSDLSLISGQSQQQAPQRQQAPQQGFHPQQQRQQQQQQAQQQVPQNQGDEFEDIPF